MKLTLLSKKTVTVHAVEENDAHPELPVGHDFFIPPVLNDDDLKEELATVVKLYSLHYPGLELVTVGDFYAVKRAAVAHLARWLEAQEALGNAEYRQLASIQQGRMSNKMLTLYMNDGGHVCRQDAFVVFNAAHLRSWMTQYYGNEAMRQANTTSEQLARWEAKPLKTLNPRQPVRLMAGIRDTSLPDVLIFCAYENPADAKKPWARVVLAYEENNVIQYVTLRRSEVRPVRNPDINAIGQSVMSEKWSDI